LERELGKALRKVATKIAADQVEPPVTIDADDVREYLGRQTVIFFEAADRTAVPGVRHGVGGHGHRRRRLFIEASREDADTEGLTLTGQLGDVMKESVQIALSYVRSHADELGIPRTKLKGRFHVHVAGGGGAQGRPQRRGHDDHGTGLVADRQRRTAGGGMTAR